MPPLMTNLSKPATVPNLIGATMWADQANARLFQFGGEFVAPAIPDDPFLLWSYDVYHDSWATRNPNQEVSRVSYGAGTTVEYLGMGYYLGGWMNSQNDLNWEGAPKASNKLVEYDMVGDTWQNRTGPNDQLGRAEGVLVFVPAGDMGMLVHFGGVRLANRPDATVDPVSFCFLCSVICGC